MKNTRRAPSAAPPAVRCSAWVEELQRRANEATDCERAQRGKGNYVKAAEFLGQKSGFLYAIQVIRSSSTVELTDAAPSGGATETK